jgi:sugar lactone lactonase YvrE
VGLPLAVGFAKAGYSVLGLDVDERSNAIFVAGGGPLLGPIDAAVHVYDAETGAELATYLLEQGSFVNDVVVTREAAYFTDSGRPLLYKVPLGPGGELPDPFEVEEVPLGPGFDFDPMQFVNANGIVATPDGKSLIIVNTGLASLYKFDLQSGEATKIDLGGGSVPNGDGLVLAGKKLYVVQNFLNQIGVVDLDPSYTSGTVRDESLTSPIHRFCRLVHDRPQGVSGTSPGLGDIADLGPEADNVGRQLEPVGLPQASLHRFDVVLGGAR